MRLDYRETVAGAVGDPIAPACGKTRRMRPAPAIAVQAVAAALDRFPWFPITSD